MHPAIEKAHLALKKEIDRKLKTIERLNDFEKKFGPVLDDPEFTKHIKNPEEPLHIDSYSNTVHFNLSDSAALRVVVKRFQKPILKSFSRYSGSFYASFGDGELTGCRIFFTFDQPHCKITKVEKKRQIDDSEYVAVCTQADGNDQNFEDEMIEPE